MKKVLFFCLFFLSFRLDAATLSIYTKEKKLSFNTEIADTKQKQETGLMYRKSIPRDYTMAFIYPSSRIVYMWMKNTWIPLDMVFFDEKGYIVKIITDAQPEDLTLKSSSVPVKGVLEMRGGTAKLNNIQVGDLIKFE